MAEVGEIVPDRRAILLKDCGRFCDNDSHNSRTFLRILLSDLPNGCLHLRRSTKTKYFLVSVSEFSHGLCRIDASAGSRKAPSNTRASRDEMSNLNVFPSSFRATD